MFKQKFIAFLRMFYFSFKVGCLLILLGQSSELFQTSSHSKFEPVIVLQIKLSSTRTLCHQHRRSQNF